MEGVFDFPVFGANGQSLLTRCISDQTEAGSSAELSAGLLGFGTAMPQQAIHEQLQLMDNGFDTTAELTSLFYQSTKRFTAHSNHSILEAYLSFTHKCNLLPTSVVPSFKRSIIASLKLTDTVSICEHLQDNAPVSELVCCEEIPDNVYGDYSEWEKVLQSLSFNEEETLEYLSGPESSFGNDLPTIKHVMDSLHQIGAGTLSITDQLKVYLLTNIKNVSSSVAIQNVLAEKMPSTFDASGGAFVFTGCMADVRFSPKQFHKDLAWFMHTVNVSNTFQTECTYFVKGHDLMLHKSASQNPPAREGRVRLRERVDRNTKLRPALYTLAAGVSADTQSSAVSQVSQLHEDSLQGWALRARVPPAISHKHKLLGYVLMSQTTFADPSRALHKHFAHDKEVYANMATQHVCRPHAEVLVEFLKLLEVHVNPFQELLSFRDECFTDFSHTDSKNLSWLKYLQLYIAAYQHEDVWAIVWRRFCTVLSHQVLVSVSNFKKHHTYAVDKVMDVYMGVNEPGVDGESLY